MHELFSFEVDAPFGASDITFHNKHSLPSSRDRINWCVSFRVVFEAALR